MGNSCGDFLIVLCSNRQKSITLIRLHHHSDTLQDLMSKSALPDGSGRRNSQSLFLARTVVSAVDLALTAGGGNIFYNW